MYARIRETDLEPFSDAISGNDDSEVCVASYGPAGEAVQKAMVASCERLGVDEPVFADVSKVAPDEVFTLIEALDPHRLVVVDDVASSLVAQAYRMAPFVHELGFVYGRPCVCFAGFEADLGDDKLKQRDWHLLKELAAAK